MASPSSLRGGAAPVFLAIDTEEHAGHRLGETDLADYVDHARLTRAAIITGEDRGVVVYDSPLAIGMALRNLVDAGRVFAAHNATFARAALGADPDLRRTVAHVPPGRWVDTMLMARALNLPGGLDDALRHLGLGDDGDASGGVARLMGTEANLRWRALGVARLYDALAPHTSDLDLELGAADAHVNVCGFPVDHVLAGQRADECARELADIEGVADAPRGKGSRHAALTAARAKWEAGAKYQGRRACGLLNARATLTGRWTAHGLQPQNMSVSDDPLLSTREMVRAADGNVIVAADYKQIELRLGIWFARASRTLERLWGADDAYVAIASSLTGGNAEAVTPEMRAIVKAMAIGLQYGLGGRALRDRLTQVVSVREARDRLMTMIEPLLNRYRDAWARLEAAVFHADEGARASGVSRGRLTAASPEFVSLTLPGSKRMLIWHDVRRVETTDGPQWCHHVRRGGQWIPERLWGSRMFAHAVSATAADVMARALVSAFHSDWPPMARVVMHAHDEIVVECKRDDADEVGASLRAAMIAAGPRSVPLDVRVSVGRSWADAKR